MPTILLLVPSGILDLPTALNSQEPAVRPPSKIVGQTMPNPLRILSEKGSCLFIRQIQLKRCQRGKIRKICTIAGKGYMISLVEFEFNSNRVYLIMTSDFIIGRGVQNNPKRSDIGLKLSEMVGRKFLVII